MANKTYCKSHLIYLSTEDDKKARDQAEKTGISLAGFWRMILRDWLKRHNKKE